MAAVAGLILAITLPGAAIRAQDQIDETAPVAQRMDRETVPAAYGTTGR